MLGPLLAGDADVVYGSRFLSGHPHRVLYYWHSVGNRLLTTASNMFTNLNLTDMETCYKAFRREVHPVDRRSRRTGSGSSPRSPRRSPRPAGASTRSASRTRAAPTPRARRSAGRTALRAIYGVVRYSSAWHARALGASTTRPDRSIPPAEFDDSDAELSDVLATLEEADNYADWISRLIRPHLGERRARDRRRSRRADRAAAPADAHVTATDLSKRCVDELAARFAGCDRRRRAARPTSPRSAPRAGTFDSVVLVNVLEHIDDDVERARATCATCSRPGGRLCVFVPAFEGLYSDFDRRIGHRRRYRRSQLVTTFDQAGLDVVDARYVNTVGALAWWLFARQLGQVPTQRWSVKVYDRVAVPVIRQLEAGRAPRFGQSLLCIGARPTE